MHQTPSLCRPPWRGIELVVAVLVIAALGWACVRTAPSAPSLLLDPQLVPGDQCSFDQPFEDGPASIRLGPGWQEPEKEWPQSGRHGIAWAEQSRTTRADATAPSRRGDELTIFADTDI